MTASVAARPTPRPSPAPRPPRVATDGPHHELVARIAATLRVTGPGRFAHLATGPHRLPRPRPDADPAAAMTAALATFVYTHYYLADRRDLATPPAAALISDREDPAFGRLLRDANVGRGYVSPGWTVTDSPGPDPTAPLAVRRGRLTLRVRPDQIAAPAPDEIPPGAPVGVRFPNDRAYAMPGFYAAVGDAGPPSGAEPMTRWYVHLTPDAAPALMRALTTGLNRLGVPFGVKVLNDPAAYTRPDAGVLYLPRAAFAATSPIVLHAYGAVATQVRPEVPAFTRLVRPGLALADEPPAEARPVSFGQHRSRLVAQGLVATGPRSRPHDRFDGIVATFAAAGISLDAPHLNPGSPEYVLPDADLAPPEVSA